MTTITIVTILHNILFILHITSHIIIVQLHIAFHIIFMFHVFYKHSKNFISSYVMPTYSKEKNCIGMPTYPSTWEHKKVIRLIKFLSKLEISDFHISYTWIITSTCIHMGYLQTIIHLYLLDDYHIYHSWHAHILRIHLLSYKDSYIKHACISIHVIRFHI